jgi:acid phosphatase
MDRLQRALRGRALGTFVALGSLAVAVLPAASRAQGVPPLDHIIVIVMENHSYAECVGLPYTSTLAASGTTFSNSYALTHPSQPNYIMMWAGSALGVTNDTCPAPGSPFTAENLGHACEAAGISWKAYSENLPAVGSSVCTSPAGLYARKHEPWTNFSNLNHQNELPYTSLALDESLQTLPRLAYVIPNQCNDQHSCALSVGDAWLSQNVPAMIQAVGPRGLVVLTYDEDDHSANNQILTVFVGPLVRSGYVSTTRIDHYSLLRTLCEALGITPFAGAATATTITDVWATVTVESRSWTSVKGLYR